MTDRLPSPQVDRAHYFRGYDTPARFASYWHQIDETSEIGGTVVEIGTGNGTVAAVLRARGVEVTTVDIDEALAPDVIADVRDLPFEDRAFDTTLAAEILEHLPWPEVPAAVSELARVARRGAVVSVPDADAAFSLYARLPNVLHVARMALRRRMRVRDALWAASQGACWRRRGGIVRRFAEIGRLRSAAVPKTSEHFWELGAVPREDFISLFEDRGFRHVRDYRVSGNPYHHFFVFARVGGS